MSDPPETAPGDIPPEIEALLAEGLSHHQAGARAAAEALFRQAVALRPDEPTALYLLGLARFEAGDADEARRLLEAVVAARPRHVQALVTLADLRQWAGEARAAAEGYRRALAQAPHHAGALVGLSQALLAADDVAGAVEAGREATSDAPESVPAQLALAGALMARNAPGEAAAAYRAAVALASDVAAAHVGLALALLRAEEAVAAEASAERAIALDADSAEAWFALGSAHLAAGEPARAVAALERAIELEPTRSAAHLTLGLAYIELDLAPEAERYLLTALDLDPESKEAHANLSSLYIRTDELQASRHHALAALEIDPEMIVPHQNLAGLADRAGDEKEARRHRDLAYGVRNLLVITAGRPIQRVLVLTTTESGNTPDRYLLPAARYTKLIWSIEYARADQMTTLPAYDVVFNAIGDQDLAGPTARNMAAFLRICQAPVLNRPEAIAHTRRDLAPGLFAGIAGVVTPPVARIEAATLAERGLIGAAADAGVRAPLLVRPIGSHGGQGLTLVTAETAAAGDVAPPAPGRDHYVTEFRDFRSADGLYRKYRVIFVDRRPYPYHLAIGTDWLIHYETSGTADAPERLAEEARFLEDPRAALGETAMDAVAEIGRRLDLDFCGVDFSLLEDGRVLLFEANATMLAHPEAADGPLAHKNPYVERILAAFRAMLAGD